MLSNRFNFAYMRSATPNDHSIEKQRQRIHEFINEHPDLPKDFEEVIDNGFSETDFDGPGIKKILGLVEKGQVGVLIVSDVSRLSRNYIAVGKYMDQVFPAHGVKFIVAEEESEEPFIMLRNFQKNR